MENKLFYTSEEVAEMLQVFQAMAYKIIRELNAELAEKGYVTVRGRVNASYFKKKTCYGTE